MSSQSSLDCSHGLTLTTSNNSSIKSYNSSIAESTATARSVGSKIKQALSRRRSKSLISMSSSDSQYQSQLLSHSQQYSPSTSTITSQSTTATTIPTKKLTKNKSIPSMFSASLHSLSQPPSHNSTRDSSISSLSDYESDFLLAPVTPLHRIEEDSVEKSGVFLGEGPDGVLQSIKYSTGKRSSSTTTTSEKTQVKVSDNVLDEMADNILDQVSGKSSIIEWRI